MSTLPFFHYSNAKTSKKCAAAVKTQQQTWERDSECYMIPTSVHVANARSDILMYEYMCTHVCHGWMWWYVATWRSKRHSASFCCASEPRWRVGARQPQQNKTSWYKCTDDTHIMTISCDCRICHWIECWFSIALNPAGNNALLRSLDLSARQCLLPDESIRLSFSTPE
jgi:hypothetical protein